MSTPDTHQTDYADLLRTFALPLYLPAFLNAICLHAITILLPLYVYEMTGSASLAALTVGLRGIGTMFSGIPASLLVSRFGDKTVVLIAVLLLAATVLGLSQAKSVLWLTTLACAFGFFLGSWQLARLHYVTREMPNAQRGRGIALMAGLARAGALVGPVTGGVLAQATGYPTVFMILACLYGVSWILLSVFASPGRRHTTRLAAHRRYLLVIAEHRRVFLTAGPVMIVLQLMRTARTLVIPLWGAHIGLSTSEIGFVFSLSAVLDMAMFYPAGHIIDTFGRRYAVILGILFMMTALLLLPVGAGIVGFTIINLLAALGNGFSTGISMTLAGDFAPAPYRSEFLGLWRQVSDIGTAAGPFCIGWVITVAGIASASVATGTVGIVGIVLALTLLPETLRRPAASDSSTKEHSE